MATIKDVANHANVSVSTVSRVINNRGYLSDTVKKKVLDSMKELDYLPNDIARSLHSQKSNIIGFVVPSVSNPFFAEMALQVETYAYSIGYKLLLCDSEQEKSKEQEYIHMLRCSKVDGIIMGSHLQEVDDYLNLNLPLVCLDRKLSDAVPYVGCDNYSGGELATRHLVNKGCKKILHFCGNLKLPMLANQRTQALKDVCEAAGVAYKICELPDVSFMDEESKKIIYNAIRRFNGIDGIFATNDIVALVAIRTAAELGYRIPEDIKVIGFDGCPIFQMLHPELTTIRQPIQSIGRYAVNCLVHQISEEEIPSQTILPVSLSVGSSTDSALLNSAKQQVKL